MLLSVVVYGKFIHPCCFDFTRGKLTSVASRLESVSALSLSAQSGPCDYLQRI